MNAPSSRTQLAVAAIAGTLALILVMSRVSDFIPDSLELPILAVIFVVVVLAAAVKWVKADR